MLLTREDGNIPKDVPGLGLFYRDTCYLGAYELSLHGTTPLLLMASDVEGVAAQIELTNHQLETPNGSGIPDHKLAIRRTLRLLDEKPVLIDTIRVRNFSQNTLTLPMALGLRSTFESMFVLRGAPKGKRGELKTPHCNGAALRFCYDGADGIRRSLRVEFSRTPSIAPRTTEQSIAHFALTLAPRASQELVVRLQIDEFEASSPEYAPSTGHAVSRHTAPAATPRQLLDGYATIETSNPEFAEVLARSLSDLALLEVRRGEHRFTAAGIPCFVGLFGRDSLLPSIQCLVFNPDLAERNTCALAHWPGRRDDPHTREQPGKILHELRVGELAHLHEVPQTPSYSSVDSTLLFLVAIARHANWTGNLSLFDKLRLNIDAALGWLDRKISHGHGYVTYEGLAQGDQPINQSWRDSGTGVLYDAKADNVPVVAIVGQQARTGLGASYQQESSEDWYCLGVPRKS